MASILRSIVAGPRQRHPDAGLDLCYVTDNIVVTSGPSSTYPARAYRNPTDALVRWLDSKHGSEWMVWEFRAEGTGYPDSEVYGRVRHYPWPDHHPPPFQLIPAIMAGMKSWLHEDGAREKGRTIVIHCKAGKGRSGTIATSYLISQEGWTLQDALNRFTQRRMRPGFGAGVSIPSQIRWVGYVERWTKLDRVYAERKAMVKEVHVWGLREGVKVSVEGFVEQGRKIRSHHTFGRKERLVVDGSTQNGSLLSELTGTSNDTRALPVKVLEEKDTNLIDPSVGEPTVPEPDKPGSESGGRAVIFRADTPVVLDTSDICIDFERRNRARYGWTMVTSVAHVWFNVFFEGLQQDSKSNARQPPSSGVFNIEWDSMDGIKGTSRKGIRAFDRLAVVWDTVADEKTELVLQPQPGEPVPETQASDWRGEQGCPDVTRKDLGLRAESPSSANLSKANSVRSTHKSAGDDDAGQQVQASGDDEVFTSLQSHTTSGGKENGNGSGMGRSESVSSKIDQNEDTKKTTAIDAVRAAVTLAKESS